MSALGTFALDAALVVAGFGLAAGLLGWRRRDPALLEASRRAVAAWAGFIALASGALLYALVTRDFSVRFVVETTDRALPPGYAVAAFWGGHAGSLLLWALVLGIYGTAAAARLRRLPAAPIVVLVVLGVAAFFTLTLAVSSNPFEAVRIPPPDGRGLNPLLRNPWMAAHPPALYFGFVGMTVPFALAVASLLAPEGPDAYLRAARPWMRAAWLCLTLGLLFGAKWSYVVLGWGGYWAWDPVENAALMPWLTGAAFLHSAQVHERDGSVRGWTTALLLLSFALSILGTFLTRSGLLSSVHAFANSSVGLFFLVFLAGCVLGSFGLLAARGTRGAPPPAALFSRETAFLVNNVLLVVAAAAVLLGTLFPILAEALTGDRISVGPPYFTRVMTPLVLLLLALMAVGPLLPWRRADPREVGTWLAAPAACGVLAALAAAALGIRHGGILLALALGVFAAGTTVVEFGRGVGPRRRRGEVLPLALLRLVGRAPDRYGGYVVHLGVLVLLAGATVSTAFATQRQVALRPGEAARLGRYEVRYEDVTAFRAGGVLVTAARLVASDGGRAVAMEARHVRHLGRDEVTAEVAIHSTWRDDLYVVLVGLAPDRRATFRILLNPMVSWLWAGALIVLAGGAIAAAPARRARAAAREAGSPALGVEAAR